MNRMGMKMVFVVVFAMAAWGAESATITVAKDGTGNVASVQHALLLAQNGDEIVIADNAVYEEDITAGAVANLVASFTLRAAAGQHPTIRAVNQSSRLAVLGIPGVD
ncbi:MAG: hypothetical protein C4527_22385 [Candidatus Omnitrophota bacterium]|jgi:glutamate dehydrogenase/leucine dehydrogenase|nr:MAG: hypothetical protein C4527_22385 [Candidatus Omnitrophota bacterium]